MRCPHAFNYKLVESCQTDLQADHHHTRALGSYPDQIATSTMFGHAFIAITALLSGGLAGPVGTPFPQDFAGASASTPGRIAKRVEGIHLVNCVTYSAVVVGRIPYLSGSFLAENL
jgi:hypothetical protein